ncbi:MAG: type II toxin-antitoxin system PemK/MazF family toxin [Pseudomonadota bacterium]
MKRGEIYYADLNPSVGDEIKNARPVLIISNDNNNKMSNTITVLPITKNVARVYPFEVFLDKQETGLLHDSKAQAHQIRTISKQRVNSSVKGRVNAATLQRVEMAMKIHLAL